jgi:hypothetical protein
MTKDSSDENKYQENSCTVKQYYIYYYKDATAQQYLALKEVVQQQFTIDRELKTVHCFAATYHGQTDMLASTLEFLVAEQEVVEKIEPVPLVNKM